MSTVEPKTFTLKNGSSLVIREAEPTDACNLINYLNRVGGESDYLGFGAGEFELTETEEADFLAQCQAADRQSYLVALLENEIVGTLHFAAGRRPRVRHVGEFGMSVRKDCWGQGVGSRLLDTLLEWAQGTGIVTKINLRVRSDNARAVALYERKGFAREGVLTREVFVGGRYHDLLAMGRKL